MRSQEDLKAHFARLTGENRDGRETLESVGDDANLIERFRKVNVLDKTDQEVENAAKAVKKLRGGVALERGEAEAYEAIIMPAERPVVDIVNDSFGAVEAPFASFSDNPEIRKRIEAAIPAVGRIGLPMQPSVPYAGTGFIVGEGLLMTNRHVAVLFAQGLGSEQLFFQSGQSADVDFKQEVGNGAAPSARHFQISKVLMIHPYWDMALLKVKGLTALPLTFLSEDPRGLVGRNVAVIGYPAFDTRNDAAMQLRIFRKLFNVKRLQPGRLGERRKIESFESVVDATTHDASTLGGNSGSAILDVDTGKVVGLHFAGRYFDANFGVPMYELAKDRRVRAAGIPFDGSASQTTSWDSAWLRVEPEATAPSAASNGQAHAMMISPPAPTLGQAIMWTIPLEFTVRLGAPAEVATAVADVKPATVGELIEKMVEPFHEDDYSDREGYSKQFLGKRVALPKVRDLSVVSKFEGEHEIPYEHFTIVLHKKRRIALYTASNVDGRDEAKKPEPRKAYGRKALSGLGDNDQEKWFSDPRIPAIHQLPDKFFTKDRGSFDKGHLVRREDVAWGETYAELRRANGDTYHVTNCSPQVAGFNRSNLGGLWGELESLVLGQAKADGDRYSVFAGPILDDDDPEFAGVDDDGRVVVRIPRRFWKVVTVKGGAGLQTFAFLLDQDVKHTDFGDVEFAVNAEWRGRMISLKGLEREIRLLEFPKELHDSDQHGRDPGESVRREGRLEGYGS